MIISHPRTGSLLKKNLLLGAGLGALVAIVAGFAGVPILIGIGGVLMLISLLLLPCVKGNEPAPPADRVVDLR